MTQLVDDYLDRLERAADHLPRARRRELVEEIEAHIAEAIGPFPTEVDVRNALERLGAPEEIVEAEQPRPAAPPARPALPHLERFPSSPVPPASPRPQAGALEVAAIVLLLIGGFLFGVGWLAGLVLLWISPVWRVRDKLIGTFLWPGGFAATAWWLTAVMIMPAEETPNDVLLAAWAIALVGVPLCTAVHLARRARN